MTGRIRRLTYLVGAFGLVSLGAIWCLHQSMATNPVRISLLGHTNSEGETGVVFQLTNQADAKVDYRGGVTGFLLRPHGPFSPEPDVGVSGSLRGYGTCTFPLLGTGMTNAWLYRAVLSVTVSRPQWQQQLGLALDRVGIHFRWTEENRLVIRVAGGGGGGLSYPRVYWSTNTWTSE
jgi:hypothetical protein